MIMLAFDMHSDSTLNSTDGRENKHHSKKNHRADQESVSANLFTS
jgi:hypothetical protein